MKLLSGLVALLFSVTFALAQAPTQLCFTTNGSNCVLANGAFSSKAISTSSATTTEIVAAVTGKTIFVSSFHIVTTAANTFKWVYGTGTACGTGTTDLTGAYGLTTFSVVSIGNGLGVLFGIPQSNALCVVTTTTAQTSGGISYNQF